MSRLAADSIVDLDDMTQIANVPPFLLLRKAFTVQPSPHPL